MIGNRAPMLAVLIVLLVAGAAGALVYDCLAPPAADAEELHQLVGGHGCGAAVDLSRCGLRFDPRLGPAPIPGAVWFDPQHGCAVRYACPVALEAIGPAEEDRNARRP